MKDNNAEEMRAWWLVYHELREATKHIKPMKRHVFTGLKNPIRVKKNVV